MFLISLCKRLRCTLDGCALPTGTHWNVWSHRDTSRSAACIVSISPYFYGCGNETLPIREVIVPSKVDRDIVR